LDLFRENFRYWGEEVPPLKKPIGKIVDYVSLQVNKP